MTLDQLFQVIGEVGPKVSLPIGILMIVFVINGGVRNFLNGRPLFENMLHKGVEGIMVMFVVGMVGFALGFITGVIS